MAHDGDREDGNRQGPETRLHGRGGAKQMTAPLLRVSGSEKGKTWIRANEEPSHAGKAGAQRPISPRATERIKIVIRCQALVDPLCQGNLVNKQRVDLLFGRPK